MMLRPNLRTDVQICGNLQAKILVFSCHGVNRVYTVAQWLERRTGDRGVLGSNPAGATSLRNFGNSV